MSSYSTGVAHVACPDCQAILNVPLHVYTEPAENGALEVKVRVSEELFTPGFEQHIMFNPDKHPTFVEATS